MFNFLKPKLTIVTHDGQFHSDDVFAVAALKLVFERTHKISILRTRDPKKINKGDIILDVGGEYDENRNRFDHHQAIGAGKRENGIPYSSFGLVWKKFGKGISGSEKIAGLIEKKIVLYVDALDNGVNTVNPVFSFLVPYESKDFIDAFRAIWKEDKSLLYDRFIFLTDFVKKVLEREVKNASDDEEAKNQVLKIYKNHTDKKIIILDRYYPCEIAKDDMPDSLIIVYPDLTGSSWCAETLETDKKFEHRVYFPKSWAGLNNEKLEEVTGVKGAMFCHKNIFFAVAKTKEAILKLAELALNEK